MSVTLFAQNLLETGTVSYAGVAATPVARLFDRDHGQQFAPGFPQAWAPFYDIFPLPMALNGPAFAQVDIDVDLGSAQPVSAWALVNHNITGVTVTLFGKATFPPDTTIDSFAATAADALRTFGAQTLRYWRVRIPAMAFAPAIGELMLGVPRVITENPFLDSAGRVVVGNVRRDYSPAKHPHSVKLGAPRVRLAWVWNKLTAAQEAERAAAVRETDEGAKALLVQDEDSALRWMKIIDAEWEPKPVVPSPTIGGEAFASRLTLEEVPR